MEPRQNLQHTLSSDDVGHIPKLSDNPSPPRRGMCVCAEVQREWAGGTHRSYLVHLSFDDDQDRY